MNHICYFYIFEYKSLHNMGISLDARYTYEMKDKVLTVRENEKYVKGLWPEGVTSLAAIVGNNGAGKTTFLEAMLHMLAEGSGVYRPNAIVVYENMGQLSAYMPNGCDYRIEGVKSVHNGEVSGVPKASLFYYSPYFRPYQSLHIPGQGELKGVYNATDTWKLVNDLLTYSNIDTLTGPQNLRMHLNAIVAQDNNRIALMLVDEELRALLPKKMLPRYIILSPNFAGYYNIEDKAHNYETYRELALSVPQFDQYKEGDFMRFISAYFFNCAAEIGKDPKAVLSMHKEWMDSLRRETKAYDSLNAIIEKHPDAESDLVPMLNALAFLEHDCKYDENSHAIYIDTYDKESPRLIREMMYHFSNNMRFLVGHLYDISYSHENYTFTQPSSGELDMLKLFSRLYEATFIQPIIRGNLYTPQLILIDEAENSYHPEWQRQFVDRLLKVLHAIYEKNRVRFENEKDISKRKKPVKFQVVMTTHSPILLSDIPRICTNYLEKSSITGEVIMNTDVHETFGTNIFDLYRYSFFLHDGMVGAYASERLTKLQKSIKAGKDKDTLLQEIDMIGDERIKDYMIALLEKREQQEKRAKFNRQLRKARRK